MSDDDLTVEDLAALARMRAARHGLLDSGAPPSTLSAGRESRGSGPHPHPHPPTYRRGMVTTGRGADA